MPSLPHLSLHRASLSDAATFARVARDAFHEAYVGTSDPADMAAHLAREFSEARQATELADPATTLLVAREPDEEWAGFAALRSGSTLPCVRATAPLEVVRFYLRQRWYGRGAGVFLMGAVLAHAAERRHDAIWLQVWEENRRAQRFYERSGFTPVGMNPFRFGERWEQDVVMRRGIGTARS